MTDPEAIRWGNADPAELILDVESLTLGELSALERASGSDVSDLLTGGRASRRLAGLFVYLLRRDGRAPSWRLLGNLRPSEVPSSGSPSRPDGGSPTSNP